METLRCYGGGKASDLTGAKTKTRYICLQCIALTFTKLSQCQSQLKSTLALAQLSDKSQSKSSRSYVDYQQ